MNLGTPVRAATLVLLGHCCACSPSLPKARQPLVLSQNAPFRQAAPPVPELPPLEVPRIERFRLDNGLEVFTAPANSPELTTLFYSSRVGVANALPSQRRLILWPLREAAFRAGMRDEDFGFWQKADSVGFYLSIENERVQEGLEKVAAMLKGCDDHPEFERLKREWTETQRGTQYRSAISLLAERLSGHPSPIAPPPDAAGEVDSLTPAMVQSICRNHFVPTESALGVVGPSPSDEVLSQVRVFFQDWTPSRTPTKLPPRQDKRVEAQLHVLDRPSNTAVVTMGIQGPTLVSEDFPAFVVLSQILGGGQFSRLNQVIRNEYGHTYGAFSTYSASMNEGFLFLRTEVSLRSVKDVVRLMREQLNAILKAPPAPWEVQAATGRLRFGLRARLKDDHGVANEAANRFVAGTHYRTEEVRDQFWRTVDPVDILQVAQRYIDPAKVRTVLVGPKEALAVHLQWMPDEVEFVEP